jgi:hypothetical protein
MGDLQFALLVPAESARGYQCLMSMVFENETDVVNCMDHPAHVELAEWCLARNCKFLFFDYDPEPATALRQPG